MSLQDDDSKTFDASVLIHDLDPLADNLPISITRAPSTSADHLTPTAIHTSADNRGNTHHIRHISVGNMVPHKFLNQAPSLIKLLDAQRASKRKLTQQTTLVLSKSMPAMGNNEIQTPSLQSDADFGTDDFASHVQVILHDSEDSIITIPTKIPTHDDLPRSQPPLEAATSIKQLEYEQLVLAKDKDEMVDLQMLAAKAAQEFSTLANNNDKLQKENQRLKEQYHDIVHDQKTMESALNTLKNKDDDNKQYVDEIEVMHSKADKWQLEKKMLMEQLGEYKAHKVHNGMRKDTQNSDSISQVGKTGLKLKRRTSEDAERLMMESLVKMTKEKNDLEDIMFKEKQVKRDYEMTISNLKKQLRDEETERQRLSDNLDQQQQLYLSFKENAKKKELEIDNIVGQTQDEILHEEEETMALYQEMDEQKAYIVQLEQENSKLIANKIKIDDEMFEELKNIRVHRFQPSMQFGGDNMPVFNSPSDQGTVGTHSRAQSQSLSNYSQSGLFFGAISDGDLLTKTLRTQINLFNVDDYSTGAFVDEEEIMDIKDMKSVDEAKGGGDGNDDDTDLDTPQPSQRKHVGFTDADGKEKQKKRQREERFKANAEVEFFLLTAIAVKSNLVDEYPDNPDVITEDAMKLFALAQKEKVVMSKFNLWIELRLREKYDLPKLEGFQKFMQEHDVVGKMDKLGKNIAKAGVKSGKFVKKQTIQISERVRALSKKSDDRDQASGDEGDKTNVDESGNESGTESNNWGQLIKQKTQELGTRIRGLSKKNDDREQTGKVNEITGIAEETVGEDIQKKENANHDNDTTKDGNKVDNNHRTSAKESNAVDDKQKQCADCSCVIM